MEYTGFEVGGFDEDTYQKKVAFAPPTQTFETNETMETENVLKKKKHIDLSQIIGTMGIKMSEPNSPLTDDHISGAKMANASKIVAEMSVEEAQLYLDMNDINKTITNSNQYGVMLRDNETGKHTLALRGMNPTDPRDILNVSQQIAGSNESRKMANEMIDKVIADGGEVERIRAFSMGGSDGLSIAMERGIPATLFDPAINPSHMLSNATALSSPKAEIEIIRNQENFISIGAGLRNVSLNPQFTVSVVPTGESGIFANHELVPNFTKPQVDKATAEAENMVRVANRFAQHETLFDMKEAMNENKTFTEFYRKLNSRVGEASGVDVDIDGVFNKLGVRVNENAPLVKLWRKIGGSFNESEIRHLNSAQSSPISQIIEVDDDILGHLQDGDLEIAKTKATKRFTDGIERINNDEVLSHPAVRSSINEHLANAVHPVNVATGLIGAFAGESAMSYIDPSGSFGQYNETGVLEHTSLSGALTGTFSDVMMNGLAGGSGLFSEAVAGLSVSAGVGAIAGEATRYGVDKGLEELDANTDTKNSVSTISGGLVGGATMTLSGDALAIASASITGAEIGELAGPAGVLIGAGAGAVFGACAYGVSKLNHVPAVKKFEKSAWHTIKGLF